ncbi:Dabb family protein [Pacificibacter marinus]|uniref:Stress responsive A/B Barrel Domain protein n=1 Tax=Pacificibacter marinus TaxID=658057 RepID=A0A1Y5SUM0_9RHOB|nr:Dabb family protein [Pacificibacter marinus]SEK83736.1 Stress responsive A/B Barrel Domain [Pacificibacter marinus]SLN48707.1 Stress responsive A/B Barrel Domain protein [Pacificibacter marinus]
MIIHSVYCAIRAETEQKKIDAVFAKLEKLVTVCDGLLSFQTGPNIDLEHKSQKFTHGFVMKFDSQSALEAYAVHPDHIAAGGDLVAICEGGGDGIMVFDLAV